MSGYRQSSYDPEAYEQQGAPLRPYNWVQWTGVGFVAVALTLLLVFLAGQAGLIDPVLNKIQPVFALAFIGSLLIGSRRAPPTLVSPEQRARNRRMLTITLICSALVIGGAALVEYLGA